MDYAARIDHFRRYAGDVVAAADALAALPPVDADVGVDGSTDLQAPVTPARLQRLREAAAEALRAGSSPIKIGIVGEFSAGKSLLIGSLIGYGDALPLGQAATTGNITWIRIDPVDEVRPTRATAASVEYLDLAAFRACLAHLLEQAASLAQSIKAPGEPVDAIRNASRTLTGDAGPRTDLDELWRAVETALRKLWEQRNLQMRLFILELLRIGRAYQSCGLAVCRWPGPHPVPPELVTGGGGITLAPAPERLLEMAFDDVPRPTASIDALPSVLSADLLARSFPLIRRIEIRFEVSRKIWDLSQLGTRNSFVLVDFPGLGSDKSGKRDLYLCQRELADIETIIVLSDGRKPGREEGGKIVTDLQAARPRNWDIRDSVIAAVGRFDQLELSPGQAQTLQELAALPPAGATRAAAGAGLADSATPFSPEWLLDAPIAAVGTLSTRDVLDRLPPLAEAMRATELTLDPERVALLSPMLALARQSERLSELPAGSPRFVADLPMQAAQARAVAVLWQGLADRLAENGPRSPLVLLLGRFAEDGGIGRLRDLVRRHVNQHGLKQLHDNARLRCEALRREHDAVRAAIGHYQRSVAGEAADAASRQRDEVRRRIGQLTHWYHGCISRMNPDTVVDIDIDPYEFYVEEAEGPVAINALIRERIGAEVFRWPEWRQLLQSGDGELIGGSRDRAESLAILPDLPDERLPTCSDDFMKPFVRTLEEVKAFAWDLCDRAFEETMERYTQDLRDIREELAGILGDGGIRTRLAEQFAAQGAPAYFKTLLIAERPKDLVPDFRKGLKYRDDAEWPIDAKQIFPLRLDRRMAWDPDLAKTADGRERAPAQRHKVAALRIRSEIVAAIRLALVGLTARVALRTNKNISELFKAILHRLQALAQNDAWLDLLASEAGPVTAAGPNPSVRARVEALQRLSRIDCPLGSE